MYTNPNPNPKWSYILVPGLCPKFILLILEKNC